MATEADIGYGGKIEVETSTGVWFEMGEVTNITPPNESVDVIEATHMQSPNRTKEFIQGLIDPGDFSCDVNWVPGGTTDDYVYDWRTAGVSRNVRITAANDTTYTFLAFVTGWTPSMATNDKMSATLTCKVAGAITRGVAA